MNLPVVQPSASAHRPPSELPRAPRAWTRSAQFFAEAFLELFGLVWLLFAFLLVFIGVGIWFLPSALEFASVNADRSRAFARRLTNVTIDAHRRPTSGAPGLGQARHTWQHVQDPVVQRDLLWHLLNPLVGLPLNILSLGLVLDGIWELAAMPFEAFFPHFRPATWYTIGDALGMPLAGAMGAAVALIAVQILLGIVLARPLLHAQGAWARLVLHVEDTGQWRRRAEQLQATRADALDLQQGELQRIERDLHDGAQMRLVSTGLTIAEAARLVRDDPDRALELLAQAKDESAAGLAELRRLVRGIRPPVLADRGLVDAIRALAKDTVVPTVVTSTLGRRLAAPLETALYFATAEILTNAVKHARAADIRIAITENNDSVTLMISDDGRGGAHVNQAHGGLAGVRRRLHTFDATLELSSAEGGPTVATITTPKVLRTTASDETSAS